jgi:hypothetical protein
MVMCVVVFHFPTGVLSGSSFLLRVQPMNGPLTYLTDRIVRPLVVRPLCLSLDGDDLAHTNEWSFPMVSVHRLVDHFAMSQSLPILLSLLFFRAESVVSDATHDWLKVLLSLHSVKYASL